MKHLLLCLIYFEVSIATFVAKKHIDNCIGGFVFQDGYGISSIGKISNEMKSKE